MRIGHGFDVHAFAEGRKLILGGVEIPYEKGLLGHSDADVLTHALMDAMLGAAGLGDIGKLFPDTDEKYKGISSLVLLKEVKAEVEGRGYSWHRYWQRMKILSISKPLRQKSWDLQEEEKVLLLKQCAF